MTVKGTNDYGDRARRIGTFGVRVLDILRKGEPRTHQGLLSAYRKIEKEALEIGLLRAATAPEVDEADTDKQGDLERDGANDDARSFHLETEERYRLGGL